MVLVDLTFIIFCFQTWYLLVMLPTIKGYMFLTFCKAHFFLNCRYNILLSTLDRAIQVTYQSIHVSSCISCLMQGRKVKLIFLLCTVDSKVERRPAGKVKVVLLSTVDSKVEMSYYPLQIAWFKVERPFFYCRYNILLSTLDRAIQVTVSKHPC